MIPRRQKRPGWRGFTTVELLVVILIIAILTGLIASAVFVFIGGQAHKNTETMRLKLHKGMKFNAEESLGASAIRDTDGDGVPEIVDGWGRPIAFFRWGTGNPDLDALARSGAGTLNRDTEDPFHKLMDQNWQSTNPPVG